jgi:hypothetical protein
MVRGFITIFSILLEVNLSFAVVIYYESLNNGVRIFAISNCQSTSSTFDKITPAVSKSTTINLYGVEKTNVLLISGQNFSLSVPYNGGSFEFARIFVLRISIKVKYMLRHLLVWQITQIRAD